MSNDKKFPAVNCSELIERLARKQPHLKPKDIKDAVRLSLDCISESLGRGGRVEVRHFGSFSVHTHKEKLTRNLKTHKAVVVSSRKSPHFKPSSSLKRRVNRVNSDPGYYDVII